MSFNSSPVKLGKQLDTGIVEYDDCYHITIGTGFTQELLRVPKELDLASLKTIQDRANNAVFRANSQGRSMVQYEMKAALGLTHQ